jgi:hypothetical protein
MNRYLLSSFLSMVLFLSTAFSSSVFAQTDAMTPDVGNVGTGVESQNRLNDEENTFEPGVGGGPSDATAGANDNGLQWLWLLPLLAIPLLYFVWRSSDETTHSRGYRE